MYNVNIKVHRVTKQYFRRLVYCKNVKMFLQSMSKRKPMHFNQISPKCRNLQSFLIQLHKGTFLHFLDATAPPAGSFVQEDGKCTGCFNKEPAPRLNLFSSKMIPQVANLYQSSLQAPMGHCKSCVVHPQYKRTSISLFCFQEIHTIFIRSR